MRQVKQTGLICQGSGLFGQPQVCAGQFRRPLLDTQLQLSPKVLTLGLGSLAFSDIEEGGDRTTWPAGGIEQRHGRARQNDGPAVVTPQLNYLVAHLVALDVPRPAGGVPLGESQRRRGPP